MDYRPGFVRVSQAWNAAAALGGCAERICISKFAGTQPAPAAAQLIIEWASPTQPAELRVRQPAWDLLTKEFSGLLRHMTRMGDPVSPDAVCALLERLGFVDMTVAEKPSNVISLARPA